MEIWNLIVKSNTFNFIILLIVLIFLLQKMRISSVLENLKNKIIEKIEMSKKEQEKAEIELSKAQKSIENLDIEIQQSVELTKKNIEGAVTQTLDNAQKQAEKILDNVKTTIENEEKQISSKVLENSTKQALISAKNKIVEKLKSNPELHSKYIDEAIENIDKVVF